MNFQLDMAAIKKGKKGLGQAGSSKASKMYSAKGKSAGKHMYDMMTPRNVNFS